MKGKGKGLEAVNESKNNDDSDKMSYLSGGTHRSNMTARLH